MHIFSKEFLYAGGIEHGSYEWTTPGTYYFTLKQKTKAIIYIVGGGEDRSYFQGLGWFPGKGGAAFVGGVILTAGSYAVIVGSQTESTISLNNVNLIYAGGGHSIGGSGDYDNTLRLSSNLIVQVGTVEIESDGNGMGYPSSGGASLYMGYGKGSDTSASNYTTGYFKIEY